LKKLNKLTVIGRGGFGKVLFYFYIRYGKFKQEKQENYMQWNKCQKPSNLYNHRRVLMKKSV